MTRDELKNDLLKDLQIKSIPTQPSGGQMCGIYYPKISVFSPDIGIEIIVRSARSTIVNRDTAMFLMDLAIENYLDGKKFKAMYRTKNLI